MKSNKNLYVLRQKFKQFSKNAAYAWLRSLDAFFQSHGKNLINKFANFSVSNAHVYLVHYLDKHCGIV